MSLGDVDETFADDCDLKSGGLVDGLVDGLVTFAGDFFVDRDGDIGFAFAEIDPLRDAINTSDTNCSTNEISIP